MTRRTHLFLGVVVVLTGAVSLFAQKEYSISAIQGDKDFSPVNSENVRVTGVVTARLAKGFFIQTPDDKVDDDPKTSEGLYVYGERSAGEVAVGNLVEVTGTVTEYTARGENSIFSITEITRPSVKVLSKDNPLPAPIQLTSTHLDPKGKLAQMEFYEGMRVRGDFVVVAPTSGRIDEKTGVATSDGTFFAVLQGTPRPFREPGIDLLTAFANRMPATTQYFDMNPEILRINSDEQVGAKTLDLPAGATIKNLTGVIDYSKKFYSLLIDAANPPLVENIKGFVAFSPAGPREVTVGSFNIHNFFDDETNSDNVRNEVVLPKKKFQDRLAKVSLAIRNVLAMPDVLGIVEVENLKALKKVADKINADAVAAGQPDPKYVAYLEEGNDGRGIDVGFLVKSSKIKVLETKQLAKDVEMERQPGEPHLFDRPPFMLRAEVIDASAKEPFTFTTIVVHLKSYNGITEARVQNKRRLEAEWLANFVAERYKADPAERMILVGDFNAFQFHDGYNDLMGTLKGKPDQSVIAPSKTAHVTGLYNLIESIRDLTQRYSYTYDGSAQALDHVMVNKPLAKRVRKFGYARLGADFPVVWANDPTRPERISDHDAPVVFLSLDEPAAAAATK